MINQEENPVEWAMMCYELEELAQHASDLASRFSADGEINEMEFRIQIGHLYSHLNQIWNARNFKGEIDEEHYLLFRKFPKDIEPYG